MSQDELQKALEECQAALKECRGALDAAREELRAQEGELGRLGAIAERVAELQGERDRLSEELAAVKADCERRVIDEVRAATERCEQEMEAAQASFEEEKAALSAEIEDLRARLEERGVTGHVAPVDLASQFANVLDDLAERSPRGGRAFSAALTGIEVEARGVLEAPREGEEQPRLVTVEAGGIDPAQLSTLRMTFRLLPRTRAAPPVEPEG